MQYLVRLYAFEQLGNGNKVGSPVSTQGSPYQGRVLGDAQQDELLGGDLRRVGNVSATVLGDTDMTTMREHFAKPQVAIAMMFSNDPQMGMVSDRFTGSATARLDTRSFAMRTASLR